MRLCAVDERVMFLLRNKVFGHRNQAIPYATREVHLQGTMTR